MPDAPETMAAAGRDHGGGIDAAAKKFGGKRVDWLDLSTGINPVPYPVPPTDPQDWTALPDRQAHDALIDAARRFWNVPENAAVLPSPGASALIARLPVLAGVGRVKITPPTYNEHAAAFAAQGWRVVQDGPASARVLVHPNNPDGRLWSAGDADGDLNVIDESFCDTTPDHSLIALAGSPGNVVLKSFGKFWGLAGMRLGFAVATTDVIATLAETLGPWAVSGPALRIGTVALNDAEWAARTRVRLARDAARLDQMMLAVGASQAGGTDLFRLFKVDDAAQWQDRLGQHHIWTRIFPWSRHHLRLGLPPSDGWDRLRGAL